MRIAAAPPACLMSLIACQFAPPQGVSAKTAPFLLLRSSSQIDVAFSCRRARHGIRHLAIFINALEMHAPDAFSFVQFAFGLAIAFRKGVSDPEAKGNSGRGGL